MQAQTQVSSSTLPVSPISETEVEKKKRMNAERENFLKDLIKRKYPELQQKDGMGMHNKEARARADTALVEISKDPRKISISPEDIRSIHEDPFIRELNRNAEKIVANQIGYYVQMAHQMRSPRSNVPWFRIVGCETETTFKSSEPWGTYLAGKLQKQKDQQLSLFRFQRMQPFMVCLDERHQYDRGTDTRVKRLLGLYENEFAEQRSKFAQHRKTGLTEDEHKTRSSFFAKEQAWREAKQRYDKKQEENKRNDAEDVHNIPVSGLKPQAPQVVVEEEQTQMQMIKEHDCIQLRNHRFPESLKQSEYNLAVISYFRDLLAFQRCFHDLTLSLEDAEFQPILIIWGLFETREQTQVFCELTRCNHAFLQKNLSVVDTYEWIPLDHVNTQNIPIQYANKYCNDIMSYKQAETRAIEEFHAWEREKYGEETPNKEFDPKSVFAK